MSPDSRYQSRGMIPSGDSAPLQASPRWKGEPIPLPKAEDFPGVEEYSEERCDPESTLVELEVAT